jgi:hypothetical protein
MSFLSKLFGKRPTEELKSQMEHNAETAINPNGEITKDLFVDEHPPVATEETNNDSKLTTFLNQNFRSAGVREGYEYHSFISLESNKKRIKAEFRLIVAQMIDEKNGDIYKLKNYLITIDGISNSHTKQIENRISELQSITNKLQREIELSIEDEGLVMSSIFSYHEGFIQGMGNYQETELFASSTGMFNNKN